MKERFKHFAFKPESVEMIRKAIRIVTDYQEQGFLLTLRQVYYQCVAHDLFPEDRKWTWTGAKWVRDPGGTKNAEPNYKWLGGLINDARLAGLLDWSAIEDRTRNLAGVSHWKDPSDIINSAASAFRIDKWADQEFRVEVWVEKDALVGVIERSCRALDIDWFSCRGYTSQSELYSAGKRLADYIKNGQTPVIIHLGDHDPSGIDMTRDIQERLELFSRNEIRVERIALNMDQIEQYNPPPNPAKTTDSRFRDYMEKHGSESWELDALEPQVMNDLVTRAVLEFRDTSQWVAAKAREDVHLRNLKDASGRWKEVAAFLRRKG